MLHSNKGCKTGKLKYLTALHYSLILFTLSIFSSLDNAQKFKAINYHYDDSKINILSIFSNAYHFETNNPEDSPVDEFYVFELIVYEKVVVF